MGDRGMQITRIDVEHFYSSRKQASLAAADRIARALRQRLQGHQSASLVVTGGTSPQACYSALAASDLAWDRVHIVPSDERWVPLSHEDSNESMIRRSLLIEHAASASFHSFYDDDAEIQERCTTLTDNLKVIPSPFAACLLGMGEDGHVASLFDDASNFNAGIDICNEQFCIPIETAASPYKRISLSLAALLRSDEIVLLFFGESKRAVLEHAKRDATEYPVSRVLHQNQVPVAVYWAP